MTTTERAYRRRRRLAAWRDVDSPRRVVGLTVSRFVVSAYIGKRLYRCVRFR